MMAPRPPRIPTPRPPCPTTSTWQRTNRPHCSHDPHESPFRAHRFYERSIRASSPCSWLLLRRVHDEPVEVVGHRDLAGQPAGRAPVGHAEVEHGVLEVTRLTDPLGELGRDVDVAGGARHVAAALPDDA